MNAGSGSAPETGVVAPSIPWDIAARAQRERILRALASSCAEKSFAATTIADIVGRASISRATFYKHFNNKEECFLAAADDFLAELGSLAAAADPGTDRSPFERVRAVIEALLAGLAAKPAQARLLLIEAASVDPEIVRRYRGLALDALAPALRGVAGDRAVGADPEIAFGRAKVLVAERIVAGAIELLPELLPELLYIALLPYVGEEAALAKVRAN